MSIYLLRDGQQFGPYSIEEARDSLAAGELLPDDMAWHEGASSWVPLSQFLESDAADEPVVSVPDWVPRRRDDPSA